MFVANITWLPSLRHQAILRLILLKKVGNMRHKSQFPCYLRLPALLSPVPSCREGFMNKANAHKMSGWIRGQPCAPPLARPHLLLGSKALGEPPERLVIWCMLMYAARGGGGDKLRFAMTTALEPYSCVHSSSRVLEASWRAWGHFMSLFNSRCVRAF